MEDRLKDDPEVRAMARELEAASRRAPDTRTEVGDAVEELFGANLRSFRTLWTAVRYPERYARAALTPDWEDGRYTPAVRLWLAMFSLMILLTFVGFAPEKDGQTVSIVSIMDDDRAFSLMLLFGSFGALVIAAIWLRWRKTVTVATNIRLMFGANIPVLAATAVLAVPHRFIPEQFEVVWSTFGLIGTIVLAYAYILLGPAKAVRAMAPYLSTLLYVVLIQSATVLLALMFLLALIFGDSLLTDQPSRID